MSQSIFLACDTCDTWWSKKEALIIHSIIINRYCCSTFHSSSREKIGVRWIKEF